MCCLKGGTAVKQDKTRKRVLLRACFLCYCVLMLWLLFGRDKYDAAEDYWERMHQNMNMVPLATIRLYLHVLAEPSLSHLISHAVVNLAGNVVMFVPLGAFLPALWRKLRKWWKSVLCTAIVITLIEIVQLFTLVGSCDVDDLILNVAGAWIGYGLWHFALWCGGTRE